MTIKLCNIKLLYFRIFTEDLTDRYIKFENILPNQYFLFLNVEHNFQ